MKRNFFWCLILIGLLAAIPCFSSGCAIKKPILIGLVDELTGNKAELGVQQRNGAELAVETINASGGIGGRKIELLIRDDLGSPEKAQEVDRELIQAGVVAIIGHTNSGETMAGAEVANAAGVVLIAPTASTSKLSGLDDYFFRVYPSSKDSVRAFVQYIYQSCGVTRPAIIYDIDNAGFAETYSKAFADKFQSLGGKIAGEVNFSSGTKPDYSQLLSKLLATNPDGLLIVASDIDTALIAQKTRIMDCQVPLFTSSWAQTETLINNGGKAVEGLKLEQSYALASQTPAFLDFQARYQARFGRDPSFGAAYGYEAALVLAAALEKTGGQREGLREALLEISDFQGLVETLSFDQFGDVKRPMYLSTISNGKYVLVEELTSTGPGVE